MNIFNNKVVLPVFNNSILTLLNKKISFYYLFFTNNTFFLYKYLFFYIYCNSISTTILKYNTHVVYDSNYFINNVCSFNVINNNIFYNVLHNNHSFNIFESLYLYINNILVFNTLFNSKKKRCFFYLLVID